MSISPDLKDSSQNLSTSLSPVQENRSAAWQVAPDLFSSFRYAWAGVSYAFRTQRNFRVHTVIGAIALTLGLILHVNTLEAAILCLTIGAVLVMELINTAMESLVDLTVGQKYHELAKITKDCAAGAVLIAAISALFIAAFIYVPHILPLLQDRLPT